MQRRQAKTNRNNSSSPLNLNPFNHINKNTAFRKKSLRERFDDAFILLVGNVYEKHDNTNVSIGALSLTVLAATLLMIAPVLVAGVLAVALPSLIALGLIKAAANTESRGAAISLLSLAALFTIPLLAGITVVGLAGATLITAGLAALATLTLTCAAIAALPILATHLICKLIEAVKKPSVEMSPENRAFLNSSTTADMMNRTGFDPQAPAPTQDQAPTSAPAQTRDQASTPAPTENTNTIDNKLNSRRLGM